MHHVRILYRKSDDGFDFIVRRVGTSRATYAADEELRGSARLAGGALIISRLSVGRRAGVTTHTLRALPLGAIRDQILRDLRGHPDLLKDAAEFVAPRATRRVPRGRQSRELRELVTSLRRRSPTRGVANDDFYRDVAEVYLRFLEAHPRDPIAAMTAELRKSKLHAELNRNTVTAWVRRARQREWLTAAVHGRAGADPGVRLLLYWLKRGEVR